MISTDRPRRQAPIGRPRDPAGRLLALLLHHPLTLDQLAERGLEGRALSAAVRDLTARTPPLRRRVPAGRTRSMTTPTTTPGARGPWPTTTICGELRADTADVQGRLRRMTPTEIAAAVATKRVPEPDDAPRPDADQTGCRRAHDPMTCGLDDGDTPPTCPACVAAVRARSAVAEELDRITDAFEAADRRAETAETAADREDRPDGARRGRRRVLGGRSGAGRFAAVC